MILSVKHHPRKLHNPTTWTVCDCGLLTSIHLFTHNSVKPDEMISHELIGNLQSAAIPLHSFVQKDTVKS